LAWVGEVVAFEGVAEGDVVFSACVNVDLDYEREKNMLTVVKLIFVGPGNRVSYLVSGEDDSSALQEKAELGALRTVSHEIIFPRSVLFFS
jgi:hypothetical protein